MIHKEVIKSKITKTKILINEDDLNKILKQEFELPDNCIITYDVSDYGLKKIEITYVDEEIL